MEFAYNVNGGSTAVMKKYQVAATNTTLGVPYLVDASNGTGIVLASTTGAANALGVNVDAAGTYVTAQQTGGADTQRLTTVIINPTAVYRALLTGDASDGTALTLYTASSGGSDGLTIVMTASVASPDMDESYFYCLSGVNQSKARKCTSTSTTTATFQVAWPIDVVANDTFISSACTPTQTVALTLNTSLTQVRGDLATTGAAFTVVEQLFNDRTSSYVFIMFGDHALTGRPT